MTLRTGESWIRVEQITMAGFCFWFQGLCDFPKPWRVHVA